MSVETLLKQAQSFTDFIAERLQSYAATGQTTSRQSSGDSESHLFPFQRAGVDWLAGLWENGLNGILADEMGLGKTVMAIAWISRMRSRGVSGPVLVVAPCSTLANWQSEFARYAQT